MKKWIISILLFILVVIGIAVKVYLTAVAPVNAAEKKAVKLVKSQAQLDTVEDFHIYNGSETVNVIEGINKKGEKIIVWLPDKSKKMIVRKANEGITKEEAIQILVQEKKPKKIISVRLGMEDNTLVWEIYYRSENNLLNYNFIDFETGKLFKGYENL